MATVDILVFAAARSSSGARLITSALRRRQVWRGRVYVRRAGGTFEPLDKSET